MKYSNGYYWFLHKQARHFERGVCSCFVKMTTQNILCFSFNVVHTQTRWVFVCVLVVQTCKSTKVAGFSFQTRHREKKTIPLLPMDDFEQGLRHNFCDQNRNLIIDLIVCHVSVKLRPIGNYNQSCVLATFNIQAEVVQRKQWKKTLNFVILLIPLV